MAFLGDEHLKDLLPELIEPFDASRIKSAHYELGLGEETFMTGSDSSRKAFLNDKSDRVTIEAGQFALLLTEEKVTVPDNMIAFISIKASQKFKGLVNISGFHVDPGFRGKLLFSVYNAGPSQILLERKQKLFSIWYSTLKGQGEYSGKHNNQDRIPIQYIENLSGDIASPNSVLSKINSLEKEYGSRITVAEGKSMNIRWMLGIFISLLLALNVKQYYDASAYKSGYEHRMSDEEKSNHLNNQIEDIVNRDLEDILKINESILVPKLNKYDGEKKTSEDAIKRNE